MIYLTWMMRCRVTESKRGPQEKILTRVYLALIGRLPRLMQRTLLVTVVVLAVVVCNYAHKAVFSIQGCVFYLGNLIK